ncbi:MAG TPA: glycosyltransferase family 2 protein [Xanthomonadaceae bacterium]|nr:glycosyltransferase family 2 protein [Xanthomonadaceae bacterium]
MRLSLRQGRLNGGWYQLSFQLSSDSGAESIARAAPVYADFKGLGETVMLRRQGDCYQCVLRLAHPTTHVRISIEGVRAFRFADAGLRRIGRAEAMRRMLLDPGIGLARRLRWWGRLLLIYAPRGARRLGDALYREYGGRQSTEGISDPYQHWVELDQRWREQKPCNVRSGPLISVLLPVYDVPEQWLARAIDSVKRQRYQDWELCIADDCSGLTHVRRLLGDAAASDARIKVVYREKNGHISAATNSALALAHGEYVAMLDHDDELHPDALSVIARSLRENPHWKYVYSDEDKIDEHGRRYDPYFKPDWNPELLLGQNYCCHLSVFETRLLREVGGFREGLEGSQDHDAVLRVTERLDASQIGHVPQVLYHWRAIPQSTAGGIGAKNYALDAGLRAIREHLARTRQPATVELTPSGYYRIRRELPPRPPKVSLVIPTRDRAELLRMSVGSILERTDYADFEILVVNNQSGEPATLEYFRELAAIPNVRILDYDHEFNYSEINNFAVRHASGEIIGLINNDIEVITADWLTEMVSHACRPEVGIVGAMLYYPDDTIQHAGVIAGIGGVAGHIYHRQPRGHHGSMGRARLAQNMQVVTAACLLVRRAVFEEVGGLDPSLRVAFNDVDFCLRVAQAGYRGVWTPHAELYHHESASRGYEDTPEKMARFNGEVKFMLDRWGQSLERDPTYNPNLSLDAPFELAFPSRVHD